MKRLMMVSVFLLWAGSAAVADDFDHLRKDAPLEPPRSPVTAVGDVPTESADLTPGDRAPQFQLDSSRGGVVRLADLEGRWSVLLFAGSRFGFAAFAAAGDSIAAMGARLYGVCQDGASAVKTYDAKSRLSFPLLSDPTGQVSQLFGMFDDENHEIQPGLVIVDATGVVRMVLQGPELHPADVLMMAQHTIAHL